MTQEELRDAWMKESGGLPSAFTISELQGRGVERAAGETRSHLERLLVDRKNSQLFRLMGLVVLMGLVCLSALAVTQTIWTLLVLLTLIGFVLFLAVRQLVALGATTRTLRETQVPGDAIAPLRGSFVPAVMVLGAVGVVSSVLSFSVLGHQRATKQPAIQTTVSQGEDPKKAPTPAVPVPSLLSCQDKRAALNERGSPQEILAGLMSLGDECPSELVLPPRALAKTFISDAIVGARSECLLGTRTEKKEAAEWCAAYARIVCLGKPLEWLEKDEAFSTFMAFQRKQGPTWTCVASRPVQILETLSAASPEDIWLTSFEMRDGAARMTGAGKRVDAVSEFMRALNNVVWVAQGVGRVVERIRNGNLRVELSPADEILEVTPNEVRFPFANVELVKSGAAASGEWSFTLETSAELHREMTSLSMPDANLSCRDLSMLVEITLANSREDLEAELRKSCPAEWLERCREVVRRNPEDADAWLAVGRASLAAGKPQDARSAFKMYRELKPDAGKEPEDGL